MARFLWQPSFQRHGLQPTHAQIAWNKRNATVSRDCWLNLSCINSNNNDFGGKLTVFLIDTSNWSWIEVKKNRSFQIWMLKNEIILEWKYKFYFFPSLWNLFKWIRYFLVICCCFFFILWLLLLPNYCFRNPLYCS